MTHTNAHVGCNNSTSYFLVMFRTGNTNSVALANELMLRVNPVTPGHQNTWNCDGLGECTGATAAHRAYVELFFHTNQSAVNWFQNAYPANDASRQHAWRYGYAIDVRLGYPR